jgi:transcriptional regulator with XRE-family HTH domain
MSKTRFTPEYNLLLTRLIELRKAAGVTQQQVADKLHKPQSHVSKCESKEREISVIDLWRWCEALNIPFSQFIREFEERMKDRER